MNLKQLKDFYNTKDIEYIIKEKYNLLEDREYTPKFSLNACVKDAFEAKPTSCIICVMVASGLKRRRFAACSSLTRFIYACKLSLVISLKMRLK